MNIMPKTRSLLNVEDGKGIDASSHTASQEKTSEGMLTRICGQTEHGNGHKDEAGDQERDKMSSPLDKMSSLVTCD